LQSKDLFSNLGRKKKAIGALAPIAVGLFGRFRTAKPSPAVGVHPAGGCGFDAVPMCSEKSGTGVE
jgi:hypothetical protein